MTPIGFCGSVQILKAESRSLLALCYCYRYVTALMGVWRAIATLVACQRGGKIDSKPYIELYNGCTILSKYKVVVHICG